MPPVALQKLVADLRAFCGESDTPNKQIAEKLGLSPSGLSDVLSGKNQLTASQQILARNLIIIGTGKPRTLSVAHDRIAELEAALESRSGTSITPTAPIVSPLTKHPSVFVHGVSKAVRANAANDGLPISHPLPERHTMPSSLSNPVAIQSYLDGLTLEQVVQVFEGEKGNDSLGRTRRNMAYSELKRRRALISGDKTS